MPFPPRLPFVCPFLLLALSIQAIAADPTYYISNGTALTPVYGPLSSIHPAEWQVWLFPPGDPAAAIAGRWGVMSAKSSDTLMAELKDAQDFEIIYNHFFQTGADHYDHITFSNPRGPVAVMQSQWTTPQQLMDASARLSDVQSGYKRLMEILSDHSNPNNLYKSMALPLREYADSSKDAQRRLLELANELGLEDLAPSDVESAVHAADKAIDESGGVYAPILIGKWTGWTVFSQVVDPHAVITFQKNGRALKAVIAYKSGTPACLWQEECSSTLNPDATLRLRGKSSRLISGSRSATFSLDTFRVVLQDDGSLFATVSDDAGRTGRLSVAR